MNKFKAMRMASPPDGLEGERLKGWAMGQQFARGNLQGFDPEVEGSGPDFVTGFREGEAAQKALLG